MSMHRGSRVSAPGGSPNLPPLVVPSASKKAPIFARRMGVGAKSGDGGAGWIPITLC